MIVLFVYIYNLSETLTERVVKLMFPSVNVLFASERIQNMVGALSSGSGLVIVVLRTRFAANEHNL